MAIYNTSLCYITAYGSVAADSGKIRHADQSKTQTERAAHICVESGQLQLLVRHICLTVQVSFLFKLIVKLPLDPD